MSNMRYTALLVLTYYGDLALEQLSCADQCACTLCTAKLLPVQQPGHGLEWAALNPVTTESSQSDS